MFLNFFFQNQQNTGNPGSGSKLGQNPEFRSKLNSVFLFYLKDGGKIKVNVRRTVPVHNCLFFTTKQVPSSLAIPKAGAFFPSLLGLWSLGPFNILTYVGISREGKVQPQLLNRTAVHGELLQLVPLLCGGQLGIFLQLLLLVNNALGHTTQLR